MNIYFIVSNIFPDYKFYPEDYYYHGLGSLISISEENGFSAKLKIFNKIINKELFINDISNFKPKIVAISTNSLQWKYMSKLAKWIKEIYSNDVLIICGGIHPTIAPEEVINDPNIDVICIGEGEGPLEDLLKSIKKGRIDYSIHNLWFKKNGNIIKNKMRKYNDNLDCIPIDNREHFQFNRILNKNDQDATVMTSRGCIYKCAFCINSYLLNLNKGSGKPFRRRSPENVMNEILMLMNKWNIKHIVFEDEEFLIDREWVINFLKIYKDSCNLPFNIMANPKFIDDEILNKLKESNCRSIYFGVETGDEELRNKILEKNISNRIIEEAFHLTKKYNIKPIPLIMLFLPNENRHTLDNTYEYLLKLNPPWVLYSIYFPIKGTKLYQYCYDNKLLLEGNINLDFKKPFIKLPELNEEEETNYINKFIELDKSFILKKYIKGNYSFIDKYNVSNVKKSDGIEMIIEWWKYCENKEPMFAFKKTGNIDFTIDEEINGNKIIGKIGVVRDDEVIKNKGTNVMFSIELLKKQGYFKIMENKIKIEELEYENYISDDFELNLKNRIEAGDKISFQIQIDNNENNIHGLFINPYII